MLGHRVFLYQAAGMGSGRQDEVWAVEYQTLGLGLGGSCWSSGAWDLESGETGAQECAVRGRSGPEVAEQGLQDVFLYGLPGAQGGRPLSQWMPQAPTATPTAHRASWRETQV